MKRTTLACASILAMSVTAGAATAQDAMDSDGDGVYSFNELLTAFPTMTEETYITIDANGDGAIDSEELTTAQEGGLLPADENQG